MATTFHMGHWIPVTWLTLGLDHVLWGMDPRGYHLTSLVFHAATAVAFYALACRLLERALPRETPRLDITLGAAASALLFAVHPLRVESVAWATERRDVVSGLFYVLALLCYLKAFDRAPAARPRRPVSWSARLRLRLPPHVNWSARLRLRLPLWYGLTLACFAAAVLSKSIAVTLPVTLLVLDVYPLRRLGGPAGWRAPRPWLEKLPFFALSAAVAAVAFLAMLPLGNALSVADMGLGLRVFLSVYGLAFYLFKTVLPLDLSPLYPVFVTITWWHFAVVAGTALVAVLMRRRWPAFTAVCLVYAITLAPVLGFFHNGPQAVADRYSYLACLGWALLAGGAVAWSWSGARVVRAVAAVIVVVLVMLTAQQVRVWRDSVSLWSYAVALEPGNRIARINLGGAYVEQGRMPEAIVQYREVLRLSRDKAPWYAVLGWLYARSGLVADALPLFVEALRLDPGRPDACANVREAVAVLRVPAPAELSGCPPAG